jgi:hypothetical protein
MANFRFYNVGRSASIVDDFTEALARAAKKLGPEVKYFPSKILITSLSLKTKELKAYVNNLIESIGLPILVFYKHRASLLWKLTT